MTISPKLKKTIGILFVIGVIAGAFAVWYVFFKPHRNVANEKPTYTMNAKDLTAAFKNDTAALSKYIDKAIEVDGVITAIDGSHLSFDNITCNIDSTDLPNISKYKVGSSAKVQGRLTTYNDLMEEILLDQCVFK